MTLWHYTTGETFLQILESGKILHATAGVPDGERPIVWFSSNQVWEQTANKRAQRSDGSMEGVDMEETRKRGGGLVRFGVDPETAPYDWNALKRLSGMKSKHAEHVAAAGLKLHARPSEWFGTFDAVPITEWTAVEIYQDGEWISLPFSDAVGEEEAGED